MKKLFKIQYILLALMLLLMGACKKDVVEKPDIPKGEDRDIQVLKVQYLYDNGGALVNSNILYHYDENGRLSDVLDSGEDGLYSMLWIEYENNQIKIGTKDYDFPGYEIRPYTALIGKNRIENILVNKIRISQLEGLVESDLSRVNISITHDGKLGSVLLDSSFANGVTVSSSEAKKIFYRSLNTDVLTYNNQGLPERIESVKGINDIGYEDLKGTPFEDWNDIPYENLYRTVIDSYEYRDSLFKNLFEKFGLIYYVNPAPVLFPDDKVDQLFNALVLGPKKFTFQYNKADDVPSKLKRLVNEELLYLNRYGVMNLDTKKLYYGNTNLWRNEYNGTNAGNWLISFGLPQYYILEEKSTHLVSKRTTDFYQTDMFGNTKYIKTRVENFPYKHDSKAKTLEIAGLKIWYEFVEEK
ncbi:MAG: hypothetical protein LC105_02020 [Chitinophagales bacterium]|nr:hypothetical protein [Chitinophagales bacterium]